MCHQFISKIFMMKKIIKYTVILFAYVFGFVGLLVTFIAMKGDQTFTVVYPDIQASSDSAIVARGRHLVYGPAHCVSCHVPMDQIKNVEEGQEPPLIGGWEISIGPMGTFRAPNLTPDSETGIGSLSDGELARALRYGIAHDGKMLFPFMPFQEMTDEDLQAVISFLRSQPAVKNRVQKSEWGLLAKALIFFGKFKPELAKNSPQKTIAKDSTVQYGQYLAHSIGNCLNCHTAFDKTTGEFTLPPFAGAAYFEPDVFSNGKSFMSPNLTPDPKTGVMSKWTEEQFILRMKSGKVHQGSPMPWNAFSKMDTVELKALFRFLKSLPPVENKIQQTVYEKNQKPSF